MENLTPPAMKPVLVNAVSDDVRTLRKTDVRQQKTVLTARALADLFAGDEIKRSNPSDEKYFSQEETTWKINFNLICDAGCRYVAATTDFVRGSYPASAVDKSIGGNTRTTPGFLYTMAVLPSGELSWARYTAPNTIKNPNEDQDAAVRDAIAPNSVIRQLFYPTEVNARNNTNAYTRTGWYREDISAYDFGDWELISGQMEHIVVTEDCTITTPAVNAVYHLHCHATITLPRLNVSNTNYRLGTQISFIQYPVEQEKTAMYASTVQYMENEGDTDPKFEQRLTPQANRNTSEHVAGFLSSMVPATYTFEVTMATDAVGAESHKEWHLLVGNDETDYTAGLAGLLAGHTTQGESDMIDYSGKQYGTTGASVYSNTLPLVVQRVAQTDGHLAITLEKSDENLADEWTFKAYVLDWAKEDTFVLTEESTPSFSRLYFLKQTDAVTGEEEFVLASSTGHIPAFTPGKQYYILNTPTSGKVVDVTGESLIPGTTATFYADVKRGQSIYISITPAQSQAHSAAKDMVTAIASFTEDPHPGTYISKKSVNPSAFTADMYNDIWKSIYRATDSNAKDIPASTQALIEGISYLGGQLQSRGLVTGAINLGIRSDVNDVIAPGVYTVNPNTLTSSDQWPDKLRSPVVKLLVFGRDSSARNLFHPRCQYIETTDETFDGTKSYFWLTDEGMKQMTKTTNDVVGDYAVYGSVAEIGRTVFEYKDQHIETGVIPVVQVMIVPYDDTEKIPASVWIRSAKSAGDTSLEFTKWNCLAVDRGGRVTMTGSIISDGEIASNIAEGYTTFVLAPTGDSASVAITLPDAKNYPLRTSITLRTSGTRSVTVNGTVVLLTNNSIAEAELVVDYDAPNYKWYAKERTTMTEL